MTEQQQEQGWTKKGQPQEPEPSRAGYDANGNEVCCWHGHANCAGCCVAGVCDLHGRPDLPEYRDGEPYGGLPRVLYRAVMDATSQAVVACMRLHCDDVPTEAWEIDYSAILRAAVATAVRITRGECVHCGDPIGYVTAVHNRRTGRSAHISCHSDANSAAKGSLAGAPVPAVDPSRSTPNTEASSVDGLGGARR